MSRKLSTGTEWTGVAIIGLMVIFVALILFTPGCSSSPKKPTTHTAVPSLDVAQEKVSRLRSAIQDAKDGVSRLKARHELIDYKESMVE